MARFDDSFSQRTLVCNFNQFNTLYFGCKSLQWNFVTKRISSSRYFYQCCSYFLGPVHPILWKNQVSCENYVIVLLFEKSNCHSYYRKVASSRLVYCSIFEHFWGATNQSTARDFTVITNLCETNLRQNLPLCIACTRY